MFVFSNLKWIFDIEIWRKHAGKHISLEFLNFNIDFIYNNLHNIWRIHSSQRTLMCCVADLQSAARRDRGAGRGAGGPQDHRDQRAERGGRAAREDRQPPRYLRGRGQ